MGSNRQEKSARILKMPVGMPSVDEKQHKNEYKLMMHTHSPFRRVGGMREKASIDAHSIGMCAHRAPMHVFCASSRQTGDL